MNKSDIKSIILGIFNKIQSRIKELWSGKTSLNVVLYRWGLLPGCIILLFQKNINSIQNSFISISIYLLISLYFLWHLFVIRRTLKAQPELVVKKIKEKDLFEGKTKEEISKIKLQIGKDRLKKALLLKSWNTTPNYTIIAAFDAVVALTQIQHLG